MSGALSAVTRRILPLAAAGLAACAGVGAAALTQSPGGPLVRGATKVTLCHATSSDKNPYVQVSVDDDSIVKENGHGDHPDDIIPPFDYVEGGVTKHYAGLNWNTTGQAIWENGCEVPPPGPVQLPIQPVLKCIDDNGVSFQAVFGYSNPNAGTVTIPAGSSNAFSPGPVDRGQPTTFQPGTVESAVTVTGSPGSSLTWTVTYGGVASSSAPASSSFPTRCSAGPSPSPAPIEIFVKCVDNTGGTFSATFGYVSSATDVVTIPAGSAANSLAPVPPAGGPPSTFQPGNHDTAFTVTGISNGTSLVWTLTSDVTRTATATNAFPTKCTAEPTPKPIAISVTCIRDRGQSFEATFGYVNENGAPVSIPIGPDNDVTVRVSRSAGQPQTFEVGGVTDAFTVTGVPAGADVEWRVTYAGVTSVATANEAYPTHCAVDPPDPPDPYRIGVFVSCVTNEGSTYSATFGYENEDTQANSVAIGDANRFFPAPEDRGQPTRFEPGNVQAAFTVTGIPAAATVIWTLTSDQTRSAEASANFETKCNPDPPPADLVPIGVFVTCVTNHGDTFDAVFGYTNDNRAEQIIPLGIRNTFLQAPGNRGQPTTFEPGTVRNAVTVTGIPNGSLLVWSVELVRIRVAVASQFVPQKCDEPPLPPDPPPPEPTPPPEPPDPTPPPPDPRPPESGLFATCVVRLAETATYDAIFGYANASQEDVLVPVGRRNFVAPTPINRGQPAVFRPGVVPVAFTVKNVPRGQDLTWAVRLPGGEIRTATASAKFPRNCITAPAPPTADLVLTKSVRDAEVVAGRRVTYTIRVLNRGPNLALRVRIEDVVDPRLDLLSASTTRGTCTTSGQRVSCTITELPPGALVSVVIAVRARTAGTIRNVASVSHSRPDPTPENNRDDAVITVTGRTGGVSPAFTG